MDVMMANALKEDGTQGSRGRQAGGPTRRCASTRSRQSRESLLRLVVGPDGLPFVDLLGRAPGRGVYICPSQAVLEEALSPKGLARLFRGAARSLSEEARQQIVLDTIARLDARIVELVTLARRAGRLEIGTDAVRRLLERPDRSGMTVVVAKDVSERTAAEVVAFAERMGVGSDVVCVRSSTKAELGRRLGRDEVGVVGIAPSVLSDRVRFEAERLTSLSSTSTNPVSRGRVRRREGASEHAAPDANGERPKAPDRWSEEHD